VLRASELKQKEVAWPFKIVYVLDTDAKVHCFNAASEDDMKVMVKHFIVQVFTVMQYLQSSSLIVWSIGSCDNSQQGEGSGKAGSMLSCMASCIAL